MKKVLGLLKDDLVNIDYVSEQDALVPVFGLREVSTGKSTYFDMRNDRFTLYVRRERILGEEYIRVKVTSYEDLEERNFKISTNLFDRFVTALEKFAEETEMDRFLRRYRFDVMRRRDDYDSDKKF